MTELISLMLKPAIPPAFCYEHLPLVVIDTEFEPLGPALWWRSAKTMVAVAPRRTLDS